MGSPPISADMALLVISAAPAGRHDGKLLLDRKFVEGMCLYATSWNDRVGCLLPEDSRPQPFGKVFDTASLPFETRLHPAGRPVMAGDLEGYDLVLCSGDSDQYLHLAEICRRAGKTILFTIEYIPETRRQIVMLDPVKSLPRKIWSLLHIQKNERRRRQAFAQAAGLQANGFPAADHYRKINPEILMYLDNRIDASLLATPSDMARRRDRLLSGDPVRLIHSGRLEPMKGSQDLVPFARRLQDKQVNFFLDIFGSGSLEETIRVEISKAGLQDRVRLHGSVDFAGELVPFARSNSDIYLSCHRQSDPSCTYLESMGCGLAVAGYANRMWKSLCNKSGAGWAVPVGDGQGLADVLAGLQRHEIADRCDDARAFAAAHLFEQEFEKRIAHFRKLT